MIYESIIAGGCVGLLGIVYGSLKGRIDKVDRCKVSARVCKERHQHIEADVTKWEENFKGIFRAQDKMNQTLARIDERVKILAEQKNNHG